MNPNPSTDPVIRISKDEALDEHVDDMLKRQMSLRGEPGVTRDHGRAWYYQNWFVFMLVGMLGAIAAWALIEPLFDDNLYFQGVVTDVSPVESLPFDTGRRHTNAEAVSIGGGSFTIRDQKIYLLRATKELTPDGGHKRFDPFSLKKGDRIGCYLEYETVEDEDLALAEFIVRNPPPQSPARERLTVPQLASRSRVGGLLLFPLVAGLVGLLLGAVDGLVCRLPRRALLCGGVGLLVGLVGGFITSILAGIIYMPLSLFAMKSSADGASGMSAFGFGLQLLGRTLAWGLAGTAMGLGQGLALRSRRLLIYGLLGGVVGGLFGGLLFDPIDLILLGPDKPSAHWSRLIGCAAIGLGVGGMIGVVELLARDAWLRMTQGPLTGKEFLLFKDVMAIGSSPRSDIYLFNDPQVAEQHAILRSVGDECELEARQAAQPVQINSRSVTRARLRHGDTVTIGRTSFVFQQRKA